MLPEPSRAIFTGLPTLTIKGIGGRITISVEGLIDRLIIGPTNATNHIGQFPLAIVCNNSHTHVMVKIIVGIKPVARNLQLARSPAAVGCSAMIVERAKDHVVRPATTPVEAVTSRVNRILVSTYDSSTRADRVLTCAHGKKDFPNGREGIRSLSIGRGLSLLLGRFARSGITALLGRIDSSRADQRIFVDSTTHIRCCPILNGNGGTRIHLMLNDRWRRAWHPGGIERSADRSQVCYICNGKHAKKDLVNRGKLEASRLS